MKFKVGDKVRCNSDFIYCRGPVNGKIYIIKSVSSDGTSIGVEVLDCTYSDNIKKGIEPNWGEEVFLKVYSASSNEVESLNILKLNEEKYYV